ncbi:hypothetical protein [Aliikangiella sp. G2MR2-5]|uniref:hypothetical protein n=1 Tax=Aliikangiella sp. G2MR2-5 TaxID=2788943 RepID=UPI0018AB39FB|nr:hypothetical protein [Aliikangiella sp. G2MR2-5]
MNPNIPIATDSVHKFYAGFGLVVFIASLVTSVYVQNSTNERVLKWFEESTKIERLAKPTKADSDQLKRIEELIKITKLDKKTFMYFLFTSAMIGLVIAGWGFQAWEKRIQPKLDEKLDLEIALLKEELKAKKLSCRQQSNSRFTRR